MDADKRQNDISILNSDLIKLHKELEKSEKEYREIFDHMLDGFAIHEIILDDNGKPVDYRFLRVNKAFETNTGLKKKDVEGKKGSQIFPVDPVWLQKLAIVALTGESACFEDYLEGLDKYFEVCSFSPEYGVFASVFRDITDQKIAEQKLQASEERYRKLIDSLPQKVFMKDCNSKYISCNISFANDIGINQDEIAGMTDFDFFPKKDAELYRRNDQKTIKAGTTVSVIEPYMIKGIQYVIQTTKTPVTDSDGKIIGIIGVIFDLTEQRKAQIELKESEEKYRSLVDNAPEAIFIMDTRKGGVIIDANDKLEKLCGIPTKELFNYTFLELSPELQADGSPSKDKAERYLLKALQGKRPRFEWEVLNVETNKCIPCEVRLVKLTSSENTFIRGSLIDISERKFFEEKLRQSEKMQAIGQLAGGIAHDFNNQLSGIMGYADLLSQKLQDVKLKEYAEGILTSSDRAASLTQQLLAFSRKGKYLSIPVDIHKVLVEVVSLLAHSIDKRIQIEQTFKASIATVIGDPTQLQNAILNIGLNARDAMPNGGTLTFETEVVNLSKDYCISHAKGIPQGNYLKISITDTGCGMDKETCEHIFEPFFTTKEQGKGTGMGLASSYGTIKSHGGAINVYSESAYGSVFHIFLPTTADPIKKTDDPDHQINVSSNALVLLVDDEEIARKIAAEMLRELGCRVTTCKNGVEAISYYQEEWKNVDLVILDMIMPNINGHDTFLALRRINPKVKAILSSGYSLNGEAQAIMDEGVLAFVGKPFRQKELTEKIQDVLG